MTTNEGSVSAAPVDPMDIDVSDVDTSFPRLAANVYTLEVSKSEVVDNKAGTGKNLKVQLKTVEPSISTEGEPLPAGTFITTNISLTPTERYSQASVNKAVTLLMQSAGLTGKISIVRDNPAILEGKQVTAKVGIQKETDEYPESNKIIAFVVKK